MSSQFFFWNFFNTNNIFFLHLKQHIRPTLSGQRGGGVAARHERVGVDEAGGGVAALTVCHAPLTTHGPTLAPPL